MRYDKNGLTYRQKEIYNYIVKFKQTNGYSPTVKEIATALYTSKSFVSVCLEKLCDMGYIKMQPNKYRTITILKFLDNDEMIS